MWQNRLLHIRLLGGRSCFGIFPYLKKPPPERRRRTLFPAALAFCFQGSFFNANTEHFKFGTSCPPRYRPVCCLSNASCHSPAGVIQPWVGSFQKSIIRWFCWTGTLPPPPLHCWLCRHRMQECPVIAKGWPSAGFFLIEEPVCRLIKADFRCDSSPEKRAWFAHAGEWTAGMDCAVCKGS